MFTQSGRSENSLFNGNGYSNVVDGCMPSNILKRVDR